MFIHVIHTYHVCGNVYKREIMEKRQLNVELIISLIIIVITILGSTIPLHLHTSSQIDAIHAEIRDFHGRLCAIEERNRK